MELRRMRLDDLAGVVAIQRGITRQPVSERWRALLAGHLHRDDRLGLVAEEEGRILGFLLAGYRVGEFGGEHLGWIENLGVDPTHMGQGVGRALADALIELFRIQGVTEVHAAVRWDSSDILSFFQRLGFDRSPYINLRLGPPA